MKIYKVIDCVMQYVTVFGIIATTVFLISQIFRLIIKTIVL